MENRKKINLDIAVISVALKMPGADSVGQFWDNLLKGKDAITEIREDELKNSGIPENIWKNKNFNPVKGKIKDFDHFDAGFFGFSKNEADIMDPQIRILHELSWEALESAGYGKKKNNPQIGIYVGAKINQHWMNLCSRTIKNTNELFEYDKFWNKDYVASRIAHSLNLKGPAILTDTACSTSLVNIHLASRSLLMGECDLALVGGASIRYYLKGYISQEGLMYSITGRCRPFDSRADGTIFSDGAGVVLLKRLDDALNDRDNILAVIKGSAINNDGSLKNGFSAPSISGQSRAIKDALDFSGIPAETITYVEAHGTATKIGDVIEIEALDKAYETDKKQYCGIGSVKSNIGHTDTASGMAGFIKTVLALKNKIIPPTINYTAPNPKINFGSTPFYVVKKVTKWERQSSNIPLRAGVSSFGIGGTNAHIILEEAPNVYKTDPGHDYQLFLLSAKTQAALDVMSANLIKYANNNKESNMADLAYTLQLGREDFGYRKAIISKNEITDLLKNFNSNTNIYSNSVSEFNDRIVFMFPGQGSQYINAGLGLYQQSKIFRNELDYGFNFVKNKHKIDLKKIIYPKDGNEHKSALDKINKIEYSQPLLFIFEYALAKLASDLGLKPDFLIGHSLGEHMAACLSGVMSFEDALKMIFKRIEVVKSASPGAMLGISIREEQLKQLLKDFNHNADKKIEVAAINSPTLQTVCGPVDLIDQFANELLDREFQCKKLGSDYALHSSQLAYLTEKFEKFIKRNIKLNKPQIPFISCISGKFITDNEAIDPGYWAAQMSEPVLFSKGLNKLINDFEKLSLIELGPGNDLTTFFLQHPEKKPSQTCFNLIKKQIENKSDYFQFLYQLSRLWLKGAEIDWQALYREEKRKRLCLPTYPFERKKYWPKEIKPEEQKFPAEITGIQDTPKFYQPVWQQKEPNFKKRNPGDKHWLVFSNDKKLNQLIVKKLNRAVIARLGSKFQKVSAKEYIINPDNPADYDKLIETINPDKIIQAGDKGMSNLIYVAQALGKSDEVREISVTAITKNLQPVIKGDKTEHPEQATILGPIKVMPREYPHIKCKAIDILKIDENTVEDIIMETEDDTQEDVMIAYRQGKRYVQTFEIIDIGKEQDQAKIKLKNYGTYLITGGLGAIGSAFAVYLVEEFKANLILIGRSKMVDDPEKLSRLNKITKLTKTIYLSADVADEKQMIKAVKIATKKFGKIDGVIHAAGEIDYGGIILRRNVKELDKYIITKVKGTTILDKLIKPDFFLLCSSISAIKAPAGEVGYVAANNFLDSFAQYKKQNTKQHVISVNWDAWTEGGMFVRSKMAKDLGIANLKRKKIKHHIFDEFIYDKKNKKEIYISNFSAEKNWFLSDHKVYGIPTIAGTVYLEAIREIMANISKGKDICINDIYFSRPIEIPEGQNKQIALVIANDGRDNYSFSVLSKLANGKFFEHAQGKIKLQNKSADKIFDLEKLSSDCGSEDFMVDHGSTKEIFRSDRLELGPRWNVLRKIKYYNEKGLAIISLKEKFVSEIDKYKLHPAIIDRAVTILLGKITNPDDFYLPLSYKSFVIKKPLAQRVYCYVEICPKNTNQDNLCFNIIFIDESGKELVNIQEFAVRKVKKDEGIKSLINSIVQSPIAQIFLSRKKGEKEKNTQVEDVSKLRNPLNDELEKSIAKIWEDILGVKEVGLNDNFFEVGGNSLNIVRVANKIKQELGYPISIMKLFEYNTVSLIADFLRNDGGSDKTNIEPNQTFNNEPIALIGYSAKFPQADNIKEYWSNLKKGKESINIKKINSQKLEAKGELKNIEFFDAQFFGYTPKEAEIMDPQMRLFHEVCFEALENAGYNSKKYSNKIGLYAGAIANVFWINMASRLVIGEGPSTMIEFSELFNKDYISTRVAHKLNLKGPAMNIEAGSSTSLVTVDLAIKALQNNQCQIALAGGVKINFSKPEHNNETGTIFSPDGHCRVFDAKSEGTVWSDGLGVVVLKRLSDAINDGDNILAVIKGSAINNDGSSKVSYSAPSVEGQAKVIKQAQQIANINPETITYIEAHGTGTKLGDPVEVEALIQAFGTKKKHYCGIGSVKANIGHMVNAAGVASLIKTVLALEHKLIPPTINYSKPNPKIDFKNSPFYVVTKPTEWKRISPDIPLRAGVSSFGIGGTNAHVILEEAPEQDKGDKGQENQLIILSAKTETALKTMTGNLIKHIEENKNTINIADLAYTLQIGRGEFAYRKTILTKNNAKQAIEDIKKKAKQSYTPDNVKNIKQRNQATDQAHRLITQTNLTEKELKELAQLWLKGAQIDWTALHQNEKRKRIPLPTYPFERQRYWPEENKLVSSIRPDNIATKYQSLDSNIEQKIAKIWQQVLGIKDIGVNDNFFEIGGNSLSIIRVANRMAKEFNQLVPVAKFFEYPTIHLQAKNIFKSSTPLLLATQIRRTEEDSIAIIGLSARFPGSDNQDSYWNNLVQGRETILFGQGQKAAYVNAKGTLNNIDHFDAQFFGYSPKEAEMMDPQIRLFHESCYEALENAGYNAKKYSQPIGLYAGAGLNMGWLNRVSPLINKESAAANFESLQLIDKNQLTTRVAHKLNLKGPAINIDTSSSTSLVTIHSAINALQKGECQIALAGGVKIRDINERGYIYEPGTMNSPDGHCRVFDAKSEGTVWSDGLGVVVLKRLSDAINDGDNILAVIKGSAINNDGSNKVSYSAPSVEGQAQVIKEAQISAHVNPETITYIEAHGTATKLGDPVEVEALKQAFGTKNKQYCAIGSVKANIGHTSTAAGVASLIKTVLALKHKLIPPIINYSKPNPKIDFKNSPFYVVTKPTEWKRISPDIPLRAGVSSFGIGGTNAHVILEEAPKQEKGDKGKADQLIILSAKTKTALGKMSDNLADHIKNNPDIDIADLSYTLQLGRGEFSYRKAVIVGNNHREIISLLKNAEENYVSDNVSSINQRNQSTKKAAVIIRQIKNSKKRSIAKKLKQLGELWICGAQIDWSSLYLNEKRRRIPLPTYPFERQRYWPETQTSSAATHIKKNNTESNVENWFYKPVWQKKELTKNENNPENNWLIFGDDDQLSKLIIEKNNKAVIVRLGKRYQKVDNRKFVINPDVPIHYEKLIKATNPSRIIQPPNSRGMFNLIYLAQALGKSVQARKIFITAITKNLQPVSMADIVMNPEQATILGPVKVIPKEYQNIKCRAIDIDIVNKKNIRQIINEINANTESQMIAYRNGQRYEQKLEKINIETEKGQIKSRLKQNGTYLITGGLGAIGGSLAEYLAKEVKANLILVGRSNLNRDEEKKDKLARLQKLTKAIYISADVSSESQMKRMVKTAQAKFGKIDGVVHAAGEADYGGIIIKRNKKELTETLAAKVSGTLILDKLINPDFFLLCSSISAIKAPAGEVGYVAANNFLDSYANYKKNSGQQVVAVDWHPWVDGGMFVRSKTDRELGIFNLKRKKIRHHLFKEYVYDQKNNREIYISRLSPEKNWFLSDHKLLGIPTIAGANYLEFARSVIERYAGNKTIVFENVYFSQPLNIPSQATKEVYLIITKKSAAEYDFQIYCQGIEHARGEIKLSGKIKYKKINLGAIKKRCNDLVVNFTANNLHHSRFFYSKDVDFGPRWQSIKTIMSGNGESLGKFELQKKFASDLTNYKLHPALLDLAAGNSSMLIAERDLYLPLAYGKLTLFAPLASVIYGYSKLVKSQKHKDNFVFDVTITNEQGKQLAKIEEFVVRKVNKEKFYPQKSAEIIKAVFEVIKSVGMPQFTIISDKTHTESTVSQPTLHSRPNIETPYSAPQTEVEKGLVNIWGEVLGIKDIGIHDNFFEIGGNSLNAIRVISKIKEIFGKQISVNDYFENSTVEMLSGLLSSLNNKKTRQSPINKAKAIKFYIE